MVRLDLFFLIFLDGLNEISDSARKELANFVSRNWRANYFCLSSQQSYPEFSGLGEVNIEPLGKEKVEELLNQRLGEKRTKEAIKKFTDETYKLYSIPRDLEFAVEIMERSDASSLPQSRSELYKQTLAPIIDAWASNGHGDYAYILSKRAYDMLCQRDSIFDATSNSMPDEIRNELHQHRYLVQRGDHYQFRHDLVRAYLAAQYFAPRWGTLLGAEDVEIDVNWIEMLKFAIPDLNGSQDVEGLLHDVLAKSPNKKLAGVLFNWLEANQPSLCQSWGDNFKLKYAEAVLVNISS